MKRNLPFYKIAIIGAIFCLPFSSFGQADVAKFLNAGIKDAETLTNLYMEPFGKAFSTALSGGWYNTGAPHKLLGFDVTLSVNYVMYPESSKEFDLKSKQWDMLYYNVNGDTKSPTISGEDKSDLKVGLQADIPNPLGGDPIHFENANLFNLPPGVYPSDLPVPAGIPLPMVNASIGLVKGTEIMGRYVPKISAVEKFGSFSLWGAGFKHDFKQWIPVVKLFPFDASIMAAYTKINFSFYDIGYYPTDFEGIVNELTAVNRQTAITKTQKVELNTSAFTTNLILSKKLLMFTVYGSVGMYSSKFDISLKGKYPIPELRVNTSDILNPRVEPALTDGGVKEDPFSIKTKATDFRAGLGLRVKLLLVTIHADYTYQDYSMITAGLGISFR